jgi:hypothetical protein
MRFALIPFARERGKMLVYTMTGAAKELEKKGFRVTRDVIYQAIQVGAPKGSVEFGARCGFLQSDIEKLAEWFSVREAKRRGRRGQSLGVAGVA